jgi:peptide/nickel transport system permease protein
MSAAVLARPRTRAMAGARGAGAAILIALLGFGLLGPPLVTVDPAVQDLSAALLAPGGDWLLGTDHLGRSMLARLAYAVRLSLALGLVTVGVAAIGGTLLGLLAAWYGGWLERGLGLLADAVLALPGLLLVLLVVAFAPGQVVPLALGIALVQWVEYFRVVRAGACSLLARPHVEAVRLLGFGPAYILRCLLWPELAPVLLTLAAFGLGGAILTVATLSFVSVGLRPPTAELGSMTNELLPYLAEAPAQALLPTLFVLLAMLGCHLLAERRTP